MTNGHKLLIDILNDIKTGTLTEDRDGNRMEALLAAIDLIESVQVDNTAGIDANEYSATVMGNVKGETLEALGFQAPEGEEWHKAE